MAFGVGETDPREQGRRPGVFGHTAHAVPSDRYVFGT